MLFRSTFLLLAWRLANRVWLSEADRIMDRKLEKKFWTRQRIMLMSGGTLFVALLLYSLVFADHRSRLNVEKEKIAVSTVRKGTFDRSEEHTSELQSIMRHSYAVF